MIWFGTSARTALLAAMIGIAMGASPAFAEAPAAPSDNAMINLVRLLVAQGTISKDKGDALIAEAEREAEAAKAALAAATPAPAVSPPAALAATEQAGGTLSPPAPGTIRVPYIPETVRNQIRDEVRADVMKQAQAEAWASPGKAAPDWVHAFRFYGDLRVRSQTNLFSKTNSTQIPNFQSIVASGPIDLINSQIPLLDTTKDNYNRMRLRVRLGADVDVASSVKVGLELASGNDATPLTTNASLGDGFFKRNIYLNKAFVTYSPTDHASITAGRMANPFVSTDALFDPDLLFDGVAARAELPVDMFGLNSVRIRGGAFPLDFGSANFPETSSVKSTAAQKWLFSGQLEANMNIIGNAELTIDAAYHHFLNLQGRPSAPCALYLGATQCSTDGSSPFFVQKGNTLSFIRRIVLDPTLPSTTVQAQPQLVGLTMPFHVLDVSATLHKPISDKIDLTLTGDYLRNLAFKRSDACRYGVAGEPINNGGSGGSGNICDTDTTKRTPYVGGGMGFQVLASIGYQTPRKWGEWRAYAAYKYLQSDAVLDAMVDDDFHLGGTNTKGFILGGALGLGHGLWLGGRWLSANEISGEPLAIDVLQFDLNVAF